MGDRYITPTGSGDKSGSSWANSAAFSTINLAASRAGSGGTVYLAADKGVYDVAKSVSIAQAGVTIKGVNTDGTAGVAVFEGTRTHDWKPGAVTGNELFRIAKGADNVTFQNIEANDTGTVFRVLGDVKNLTIDRVDANNVAHYLNDLASGGTASITGLTITNAEIVGFSKAAIAIDYDSSNIVIRDVVGNSKGQDGDNFAMGIHLDGTTHNVLIERVTMENATATGGPSNYWQGDGFATEGGTYDITFRDTIARGNTDGGYDLKSDRLTLIDTLAEGNGRNYRIWGTEVVLKNAVGLDPHKMGGNSTQSQLWIAKDAAVTVIDSLFSDSGSGTKAVYNDGGALTFVDTTLHMAEDAIAFFGKRSAGDVSLDIDRVAPTGRFSLGSLLPNLPVVPTQPVVPDKIVVPVVVAPVVPPVTPPVVPAVPDKVVAPVVVAPVVLPDSAAPPVTPVRHVAATVLGETLLGSDAIDLFRFDNSGKTGADTIRDFRPNDLLATAVALSDRGGDGIIQLSTNMIFGLGSAGDTVKIEGLSKAGVRYLGQTADGHLYGDTRTRPGGAKEGLIGINDVLNDGDAKDKVTNKFFFDTAIDQRVGHDKVGNFGSRDVLMTTSKIGTAAKGEQIMAVNGAFALGHDGIDLGSVAVTDIRGNALSTLKYDGMMTDGQTHWFVYSALGSSVGTAMAG